MNYYRCSNGFALPNLYCEDKTLPITLAYGSSGTGKLTALHCGLGLVEAGDFYKVSPAKAFELCSITSIPMGYNDPDTKHGFSSLIIIDLYHASRKATKNGGELVPTSTCIILISSNIPSIDRQR